MIRLKKHVCNQLAGWTRRVVIVTELEVLYRGEQVGGVLGNPVTLVSDGKVRTSNIFRSSKSIFVTKLITNI